MACMEGDAVPLAHNGVELNPDRVITAESIFCGFTVYLCAVQWMHVYRERVRRDSKNSETMIPIIILAVCCVALLLSEVMEIVAMVYVNVYLRARENYCVNLKIINEAKNYTKDLYNLTEDYPNVMRYCNLSSLNFEAFPAAPACPEIERRNAIDFDIVGRNCGFVAYAISFSVVYGVIWHMQRSLYRETSLAHLSNKLTRFISKYFIVYVITVTIGILTVWLYFFNDYSLNLTRNVLRSGSFTALLLLFSWAVHLPVLVLLIYPLIRVKAFNRNSNIVTRPKYVGLIKRIAVLTAACLASDTVVAVAMSYHFVLVNFRLIIPHINIKVNLVCVNLIATDWKSRLAPWIASRC